MGAGASIPATEEEALAQGYTAEQIKEYKERGAEGTTPTTPLYLNIVGTSIGGPTTCR